MKKISKTDSGIKAELVTRLEASKKDLEDTLTIHNETVGKSFMAVSAAVTKYNDVIEEANDFRSGIASDIQSYMEDRSEAWHEGDSAAAYEEWHSSWDEEFETIEIDEPDELEMPDNDAGEQLQDKEEEVQL